MKKLLSCAVIFCAISLVGCSKANNADNNTDAACNDSTTCTEQKADCKQHCETPCDKDSVSELEKLPGQIVDSAKDAATQAVNNAVEGAKEAATQAVNNAINDAVDAGTKAVEDLKQGAVEKLEEGAAALKK